MTDPRVFKSRAEIVWDPSHKPPTLHLPEDTASSKFNFRSVRKVPFSFDSSENIDEGNSVFTNHVVNIQGEKAGEYNPKDDFENVAEPTDGMFEIDYDEKVTQFIFTNQF